MAHAPVVRPSRLGFAERLTDYVRRHGAKSLRVTGPADSPVARVRNRFRVQSLVRGAERSDVRQAARFVRQLAETLSKEMASTDVRWSLDIDAVRLL